MTTIQLTGADINGDRVSCTIEQLLVLLKELAPMGGDRDLIWYGADVEPALGPLAPCHGAASKIGTYSDFLSLLDSLKFPQIDFGLFIAIHADASSTPAGVALFAEGPGGARWPGSVIELLAFDDTYIEVTSERADVVHKLMARFPTAKNIGNVTTKAWVPDMDIRSGVLLSVQRALVGSISAGVRYITCRWSRAAIEVRAIYDRVPTSDDREDMSIVETEILADFPRKSVQVKCVQSDALPAALMIEGEVFVYGRREALE